MSAVSGGIWTVHGTKKGTLPVQVEKRPMGKKVTLIQNVFNPDALGKELKVALGTGSTCRPGEVQLQGDHADRVTKFLLTAQGPHLIGVSGTGDQSRTPSGFRAPVPTLTSHTWMPAGKSATAKKEKVEATQKKEEDDARERERLAGERRQEVLDGTRKPKWSQVKRDAVAAANTRVQEPTGWSDDPRRCPFNWIYCSGLRPLASAPRRRRLI